MRSEPSAQLQQLAALVRAPLDGVPTRAGPIDRPLVEWAVRRHRVGPLLYAASRNAAGPIEPACAALLEASYKANRLHQAHTELLLKNIAVHFSHEHIPWLVFKGLPQARQLYADPAWRHSNDVDLLVPAAAFTSAVAALERARLVMTDPPLPIGHWLARSVARLTRDVQLEHRATGISFELHQRLFFAQRIEARVPILEHNFRARVPAGREEIPAPQVDAGLALYLLLHGAATSWFRLKWLADLVPLFAKLGHHECAAIADGAEKVGAAASVKASLKLLELVFGGVRVGALEPWVAEGTASRGVQERLLHYLSALNNPSNTAPTPADDKLEALRALALLIDGPSYRAGLLLRGAASSALRGLARRWPRRRNRNSNVAVSP